MKKIVLAVVAAALLSSLQAQDGIYGSFLVGYKNFDMSSLDAELNRLGHYDKTFNFGNQYLTLGGEGHIILAKHLVVGGKAIATYREQEANYTPPPLDVPTWIKITTGMGIGTLGFAFLAGDEKQLRIFPQVGIGASSFLLQRKTKLSDTTSFEDVFADDNMSVMQTVSLAVDLALSFDWYIRFIEFKKIIPGLGFGPLIHITAGYTFIPGQSTWLRDIDDVGTYNPNLSFEGFYACAGVGIGLSAGD